MGVGGNGHKICIMEGRDKNYMVDRARLLTS